jgi:hypothetical protein
MIMKRQPGAGSDYAVLIISIPHALTADNLQIQTTARSLITLFPRSFLSYSGPTGRHASGRFGTLESRVTWTGWPDRGFNPSRDEIFKKYLLYVISTIGRNPCPEQNEGYFRFLVAFAPRNDKSKVISGKLSILSSNFME